jgi:hypothetical protein
VSDLGKKNEFFFIFYGDFFFLIEKVKTWVHQLKPVAMRKKIKTHNRKKVNPVWAIMELVESKQVFLDLNFLLWRLKSLDK